MAKRLSFVEAVAPSTIANLGPGFDRFGLSVDTAFEKVRIERKPNPQRKIRVFGIGAEKIPTALEKNTAGLAVLNMLKEFRIKDVPSISLWKGIRPGSGLGSSSSSAVAAVVAANEFYRLGLSKEQLVYYASLGEVASANTPLYDNVASAIFGGFVIVCIGDSKLDGEVKVLNIKPPKNLSLVIALPDTPLLTKVARAVVPKHVSMAETITAVEKASSIVVAMKNGDIKLLGSAVENAIVDRARAKLIKGFNSIKSYAKRAGASGVMIGGAGPAIVAIVDKRKFSVSKVANAMEKDAKASGVSAKIFISRPCQGAKVIRRG